MDAWTPHRTPAILVELALNDDDHDDQKEDKKDDLPHQLVALRQEMSSPSAESSLGLRSLENDDANGKKTKKQKRSSPGLPV